MKRTFVVVAVAAAIFAATGSTASAMPNFAQALGVKCSLCHTQVPALNAYGRYVQRTGYSALDPHTLRKEYPLWIDASASYTEQTPNAAVWQGGNVALHVDGAVANDWTYHVQQWLVQGNEPGGTDTMWVAYNNLFNHSGHLFYGKVQSPVPSPYSQWMDLTSFAAPEMTVGEHTYDLDANRWGTKFAYIKKSLDAEVAYLTDGNDIYGFNDYTNDTEKTLQWKLAYANPTKPLEIGYFGSRGSFPLPEGGYDQFYSNSFYVQRDPGKNHIPGVLATYQMSFDGNPGAGAPPSASNGGSIELFEPIGPNGMFSAAEQWTNDGMGNQVRFGTLDASYHVMRFVNLYAEEVIGQQQKPTWNGLIWFALPVGPI